MESAADLMDHLPRILFVDDEVDNLAVCQYWCKLWGYSSMGVSNPLEAVSTGQSFRPDLVFLDINMPVIDGFEVMSRFKADPVLASTPIIMLSGEAVEVRDKVKGIGSGAMDYLLKPIAPEELKVRIASYLNLRDRARKQFDESELKAVRQTATFLNHSINNLLATIQAASSLADDESSSESRLRHEIIETNVRAIAEIVQRLREIKRVMATPYPGLEEMLDLDKSTSRESPED